MNRICIEKSTGKLIEFQSGKSKRGLGTLTDNAVSSGKYKESEVEEKYTEDDYQTAKLKHETAEEKIKREAKEAVNLALNDAKKVISDKYKDKKKSDITDSDTLEWIKLKMSQEFGLDV